MMTLLEALGVAVVALLPLATAELQTVQSSDCNCYLSNSTQQPFFAHHNYFDFRNLSQYAGVPNTIDDPTKSAAASASSDYFKKDEWKKVWAVQSWNNSQTIGKPGYDAKLLLVNSPNNVYIQANDDPGATSKTYLTMRTRRFSQFQSAAEMDSVISNYQFLSIRMLARARGPPGAVAAMFTYRGGDQLATVQEADMEILTRDPPTQIQYTNQPAYTVGGDVIKEAHQNVTMPENLKWSDWAYHRLDWSPGLSTWYVNGRNVSTNSFQAPRDGSQVIFNSWSNGGNWTGEMAVDSESYLQIQWMQMVYNTTDDKPGGSCNSVCSIDQTTYAGQIVSLFKGNDAAALGRPSTWLPAAAAVGTAFLLLFL